MKNIIFQSATEITRQIRDKEISCERVVREFLEHIKKHNNVINEMKPDS